MSHLLEELCTRRTHISAVRKEEHTRGYRTGDLRLEFISELTASKRLLHIDSASNPAWTFHVPSFNIEALDFIVIPYCTTPNENGKGIFSDITGADGRKSFLGYRYSEGEGSDVKTSLE